MGDYRDARDNATIILTCSNVCPFKWHRNVFGCPCCSYTSPVFTCLKNHMGEHPLKSDKLDILKNSRPSDTVKTDVADLRCDLCQQKIDDIPKLMDHLHEIHNKPIIKNYDSGIVPYLLDNGFTCAYCNESFERFVTLNTHMFDHFPKCACAECGLLFSADRLRKHVLRTHEKSREIKFKQKSGEYDARHNATIILECSNVCPFKWRRNVFGCAYCPYTSPNFTNLKTHMDVHPTKAERIEILRNSRPTAVVKTDVTNLKCVLCQLNIENIASLMSHLKDEHDKHIIKKYGSGIIPYLLEDRFKCAYGSCGESFDCFIKLNTHVKSHNIKCTCAQCGQFFCSSERLRNHTVRKHGQRRATKLRPKFDSKSKAGFRCESGFYDDARHNAVIIVESSNVCLFKWYRNVFGCASCEYVSADFGPIRSHVHNKRVEGLHMRYTRPTDILKAEVTDLKCKLCDQAFHDLKTLLYHLGESHNKPIKKEFGPGLIPFLLNDSYSCADCGLQFDRFTKLNCHMNQHFPNCICSYCGQAFTNANRLKHHTWHHKQEKVQYKCTPCKVIFTTRYQKQKHMLSKHGKLSHKCPYCNEMFKSYYLRLQHLNDKHGKKIQYPCNLCSEIFKTASRRAQHVRYVHIKSTPHSCSICNYSCMTAAHLKRHMIRHGGERKYKCEVCMKAYPRSGALALHMRIHNNDKRFVCTQCKAAFVQKCSLKSHMKTHHPYDNEEPSSF